MTERANHGKRHPCHLDWHLIVIVISVSFSFRFSTVCKINYINSGSITPHRMEPLFAWLLHVSLAAE